MAILEKSGAQSAPHTLVRSDSCRRPGNKHRDVFGETSPLHQAQVLVIDKVCKEKPPDEMGGLFTTTFDSWLGNFDLNHLTHACWWRPEANIGNV